MPTVPRKMLYPTTIRQLGARTFRCYILPVRDWTDRAGVQQGNAPVYLPVKIYTNFLR